MDQATGLKAVILGASGAVGRELVRELLNNPKWTEVSVIVRRSLEQWDNHPNKQKLKVTLVESLDVLEQSEQWKFLNYNTMFCCLGSRTKEGDAIFTKVDLVYPQYGGKIAMENKIPHYSLISSIGADKTSMFIYTRVKGQVEEALTKLGFPMLSIMRPGLILNRDNDVHFGHGFFKLIPFLDKIESRDIAKGAMIDAETIHSQQLPQTPQFKIFSNKDMLNLVK